MKRSRSSACAMFSAAMLLSLVGCEAEKSSNPLSPSIAGPIPGVSISAPRVLEPAAGTRLKESQQPIRLMVENATTSGVRPLAYSFEVATDTGFATKVYARSAVPPGDGGHTSVQIDRLELGRSYYWRVRAEDGANTSAYSTAQFEVLPRPFLSAPLPLSPINNEQTGSRRPALRVRNVDRNAAIGGLVYEFQVSSSQSFNVLTGAAQTYEGNGETEVSLGVDLPGGSTQYWRARAFDAETMGDWGAVQSFRTPGAISPSPSPSPGGPIGPLPDPAPGPPGTDQSALVAAIVAQVNPSHTPEGAFEVTKRVAWALRGQGAGLLIKNGGENIVSWQGYSFSASRICYPDGHIYKVLSDVPATNGPTWQDNDFVDRSLYVPAIDPNR